MSFFPRITRFQSDGVAARLFHCVFCSGEELHVVFVIALAVIDSIYSQAPSVRAGLINVIALKCDRPPILESESESNAAGSRVIFELPPCRPKRIGFPFPPAIALVTSPPVFSPLVFASWFTANVSWAALHATMI